MRDAKPYFEDIPDLKLPEEMRELAAHIVERKASHFDPDKFEDHYEEALIRLLQAKQKGRKFEQPEAPPPGRVINLIDALRASIESDKKSAAASHHRKPAKKKSG